MRLSLVAGTPPAKPTTALIRELEAAGVHIPGISPGRHAPVRHLRLLRSDCHAGRTRNEVTG